MKWRTDRFPLSLSLSSWIQSTPLTPKKQKSIESNGYIEGTLGWVVTFYLYLFTTSNFLSLSTLSSSSACRLIPLHHPYSNPIRSLIGKWSIDRMRSGSGVIISLPLSLLFQPQPHLTSPRLQLRNQKTDHLTNQKRCKQCHSSLSASLIILFYPSLSLSPCCWATPDSLHFTTPLASLEETNVILINWKEEQGKW